MADFDLGGLLFGNAPSTGFESYLDPEQLKRMQNQGVMQAAMALLRASGPSAVPIGIGQALGEAYGAGQTGYQQAQQQGIAAMMTKQKLDEAAADRRLTESFASGNMGASLGLTPEQARIVAMNPKALLPKVLEMQLGRKEVDSFTPMTVEQLAAYGLPPGTSAVIGKTGKPEILSAAEKPEASPTEVKLLNAANMPVTFENIVKLRQSGVSPGTTINMPGNKELLGGVGKDISATLSDLTAGARTANQALQTIDRMLPALDKAIVGPAADYRTSMLRIGQQLGIAGADANAVLANTRTVVQGLAQQELDAASQMKGQGSLTEAERAILKRAASGDQTLSAAEIQQSLSTAQKVARYRLQAQQDYLGRVSKLPDFQQFAPMYQVTPYQSQNQFPADIQNILNNQRRLPGGSRP